MLTQREAKRVYIGDIQVRPGKAITTAGIYHNSDLGIISISANGTNWITIADKNLGATSTDTSNISSYGNYFQWGNCYPFSNTANPTKSSTAVNARYYGPLRYYSSSTFTTAYPWDSSNNLNLWGDTTDTDEARQGPCPKGFHIPSNAELVALNTAITGLGLTSNGTTYQTYLFMPSSGWINVSGSITSQGSGTQWWSTTSYSSNINTHALGLYRSGNTIILSASNQKRYGFPIRPFKNEAVQPREGWEQLYPEPLKSYAEIEAMQNAGTQNAEMLAELNTAPYEYYSSFSGTHIVDGTGSYAGIKLLSPDGTNIGSYGGWFVGYYPNDYPTAQYRNTWNIAG